MLQFQALRNAGYWPLRHAWLAVRCAASLIPLQSGCWCCFKTLHPTLARAPQRHLCDVLEHPGHGAVGPRVLWPVRREVVGHKIQRACCREGCGRLPPQWQGCRKGAVKKQVLGGSMEVNLPLAPPLPTWMYMKPPLQLLRKV